MGIEVNPGETVSIMRINDMNLLEFISSSPRKSNGRVAGLSTDPAVLSIPPLPLEAVHFLGDLESGIERLAEIRVQGRVDIMGLEKLLSQGSGVRKAFLLDLVTHPLHDLLLCHLRFPFFWYFGSSLSKGSKRV